ncbi:MAG: hypothetical protein ACK4M3_05370 [Pyrobaculum sp.]
MGNIMAVRGVMTAFHGVVEPARYSTPVFGQNSTYGGCSQQARQTL